MLRIGVLALILGFSTSTLAAVVKPADSHKQQVEQPKVGEQLGTDKSPVVVKLENTGENDADKREKTDATNTQERIDLTLVIVAIVTAIIALWQGRQLKRTVEASIGAERPNIWPVRLKMVLITELDGKVRPQVTHSYRNLGRSVGTVVEFRHDFYIGPVLPYRRKFRKSAVRNGANSPIEPSGGHEPNTLLAGPTSTYHRPLTQEERTGVENGTLGVGFFGYVKYRDNFGFEYDSGYCFRFMGEQNFIFINNYPAYYYEKTKLARNSILLRLWASLVHRWRMRFDEEPPYAEGENREDFDYY